MIKINNHIALENSIMKPSEKMGATAGLIIVWLIFLALIPPSVFISWVPLAIGIKGIWTS